MKLKLGGIVASADPPVMEALPTGQCEGQRRAFAGKTRVSEISRALTFKTSLETRDRLNVAKWALCRVAGEPEPLVHILCTLKSSDWDQAICIWTPWH